MQAPGAEWLPSAHPVCMQVVSVLLFCIDPVNACAESQCIQLSTQCLHHMDAGLPSLLTMHGL